MKVRSEQRSAMARSLEEDFVERMVRQMRRAYPEVAWQMDLVALRVLIERGIAHAASYGMRREETVARFLEYRFAWGEDLGLAPARAYVMAMLADESLSERARINAVDMIVSGVASLGEDSGGD